MNRDEIRELNGLQLARMVDISTTPDFDGPGAKFLATIRDAYLDNADRIRSEDGEEVIEGLADGESGGTPAANGVVTEVFTETWAIWLDLGLWQEYEEEWGDVKWHNVSMLAQNVMSRIAENLLRALRDEDDGQL